MISVTLLHVFRIICRVNSLKSSVHIKFAHATSKLHTDTNPASHAPEVVEFEAIFVVCPLTKFHIYGRIIP
jgi:hypothetical protein